ncbi:MAG TPA: pyridoxamine 5'-phosphate oxidase family protein, partial [Longimicrobiaceae bacterium]|nr:pyridoxamine 5'-phosphate oxidase family protein [Longimicrobiaceae bacterium]
MDRIAAPEFRTLTREEIAAVLRRNHVGRIAFSWRDRVDIQPIHYVFVGGWIYGRTTPGAKLTAVSHNRWVAFEVDEIEEMFA